jgi:hypothetical protein
MATQPPNVSASEHFTNGERQLRAALTLAKGRERDRDIQVAQAHALLAIAAVLLDGQTIADEEEEAE